MTDLEIRELQPTDAESYLECHRRVFGEEGGKSLAEWRWAFTESPLGPRAFVALRDGCVVAAYAGLARRTWIGGEERALVQVIDSMVDPGERRGLRRRGLHVAVGEAFFDAYGGESGDVGYFGWPMPAALRIGERFLRYDLVREELVLVRELGGEPSAMPEGVEELTEVGEDLKWLWDRCAPEWGAATIRDAAWARRRFLEHPRERYTLLGVRKEGILRGLAVLREGAWSWGGAAALCDWLVPPAEEEVARALERAVRARAAAAGSERLVALFPEWSPPFASFQDAGWRVRPAPFSLAARSFDRRFDLAWLRAHWWYTLADSDLA